MQRARCVAALSLPCLVLGCEGLIGDPLSGAPPGVRDPDAPHGGPHSSVDAGDSPIALPGDPLPPREPLHRLNRLEYDNTTRDLLGVDLRLGQTFPPDGASDGFDNLAEGLSLSPSLMGLYADAARQLVDATLDVAPRYLQRFEPKDLPHSGGFLFGDWGWALSGSSVSMTFAPPQAERVTLSILAGGTQYGGAPAPNMTLQVDGTTVQSWTVTAAPATPELHQFQVDLPAGDHVVRVAFTNHESHPGENRDNQVVVGTIEARSDATVIPATRAAVYVCEPATSADPDGCHREIVTRFAARAWRRPLTADEATGVVGLWQTLRVEEGDAEAIKLVVRAMLLSSRFLYRASFPSAAAVAEATKRNAGSGPVALDDYTLASRLSYFLWSSMPDSTLLDDAASGALQTDDGLRVAVQRMLADPKAAALRDGFATQWLGLRQLALAAPSPDTYPEFDDALRSAMSDEAALFFQDFLSNGLPLARMADADFSFVNDRLAQHYGLPAPGSAEPVRVQLADSGRRGLLTHAAWLTAYSEANRTSPVRRGRHLLEQVLCSPVPPPPPDIPAFKEHEGGATIRETLALHREQKSCAVCHDRLDPMGLGLEQFDGIGKLRDTENGQPIDTSGALVDGPAFNGGAELAALVGADARFPACLTEQLLTYALGHNDYERSTDRKHWVRPIAEAVTTNSATLAGLIEAIVLSPAFRTRVAPVEE